jgi:VWFA-related protein
LARRSSLVAALIALAATYPVVQAQKPPDPAADAASASTPSAPSPDSRTVRVEAIVTDKQGKPIVNLRSADFAVLENGVAQKIESAVLMTKVVAPSTPAPIESAADAERAAREPGTRVIAIYLDEFHVRSGESTERVRYALSRFIEEQLRPTDLVVVMKPLDHVTDIKFTRDRDIARKAVASFDGRKDDYTPRTPFEEQYVGRAPEAVRTARAQIVMSGLRALATRIGELDGGLAGVVLVTEGFSSEVPRSRERRLPDLQGIVRAASRFRVLLYAFDPGGAPAPSAAETTEPERAIQSLARQTGGGVVIAGDDLVTAFERVSRDLDTYYVLTYQSSQANDGRFHELQVTSPRRGALVRTRSGYWAPLPFELRAAARTSSTSTLLPMRAVRRSPLIEPWFGSTVEADGRRRVIFTWVPAPASPLVKQIVRPEVVALKVSTVSGTVLFEGEVAAAHAGAVGTQRPDSAVFEALPGRLLFDYSVLRADGSKLDTGAQDFDIPEMVKGPPVILPPQLFRAASAREFREISADSAAAPLPGRDFRRTDHLLVRVPTYDPAGGRVQVSVKLMNRVGMMLVELAPVVASQSDRLSQFDLSLARFAPGEYSLELAAQSESGTARQLIRFRITG